MVLTEMICYKTHVEAELTLYNWFESIHGNVINKLSAVGLIRTEEVAVA